VDRLGLDLSHHLSRRVTRNDVHSANLVLTMTRGQVRGLIDLGDDMWRKCFPLKVFVRRAEAATQNRHLTPTDLAELVADGRTARDLLGDSQRDDITDPMGRSMRVWQSVIAELDDLVNRLAPLLAPSPARHGGRGLARRAPLRR
jgi:protein-tyrosine-phosphatase